MEIVLRSRAFFAALNIGTRVLGPAEFVLGPVRALELVDPPPSVLAAGRLDGLASGLDLFDPPNVGGWPGGRAWLNSQAVIGRRQLRSGPPRRFRRRSARARGPAGVRRPPRSRGQSGRDRRLLRRAPAGGRPQRGPALSHLSSPR